MAAMMGLDIMSCMVYTAGMKKRKSLSDELREAIDASGMSRYAICKAIGLDQAEMSRFMARKYGLRIQVLDRLAEFLDLHLRKGE